jgi:hypothetical protein
MSVLKHVPRVVLYWSPAPDGDGFVVRFEGEDWRLTPTPKGKRRYPWRLEGTTSRVVQEIGGVSPADAQQRAAMWLDISSRFPYPRSNG